MDQIEGLDCLQTKLDCLNKLNFHEGTIIHCDETTSPSSAPILTMTHIFDTILKDTQAGRYDRTESSRELARIQVGGYSTRVLQSASKSAETTY